MFKIETHLHTTTISPCGRVTPEEIVRRYYEADYHGLVVTDHYRLDVFEKLKDAENKLHAFLEGYRQVKYYADRVGIKTYYGAELQFSENHNDYLLFGFSDALMADPEKVCRIGVAAFSELAREDGALLIQAHPFRNGCVPVAPYLLDGVEAINRHDKHTNRNELATAYADRYGMLKTSGGDFHDSEDICVAGIAVDRLPNNSMELAKLLHSGDFQLLGWENTQNGNEG